MPIYLVERTDEHDWDEYNAVVVRASGPEAAVNLILGGRLQSDFKFPYYGFKPDGSNAKVSRVEETGQCGEILASFNAG